MEKTDGTEFAMVMGMRVGAPHFLFSVIALAMGITCGSGRTSAQESYLSDFSKNIVSSADDTTVLNQHVRALNEFWARAQQDKRFLWSEMDERFIRVSLRHPLQSDQDLVNAWIAARTLEIFPHEQLRDLSGEAADLLSGTLTKAKARPNDELTQALIDTTSAALKSWTSRNGIVIRRVSDTPGRRYRFRGSHAVRFCTSIISALGSAADSANSALARPFHFLRH